MARAALRKFIPNDPEAEPLQRVLGLCLLCTAALWGGAQRRQVKGSGCRCVSESELLRPEKTKPRFYAPASLHRCTASASLIPCLLGRNKSFAGDSTSLQHASPSLHPALAADQNPRRLDGRPSADQ